jgi:hypothetical protein
LLILMYNGRLFWFIFSHDCMYLKLEMSWDSCISHYITFILVLQIEKKTTSRRNVKTLQKQATFCLSFFYTPRSPKGEGGILFYLCPSVQDIFRRIFLSNCWWQKSDIWSQASYSYPILWEAFFDPSDSYFLFAEERGYHRWALAHSSSCFG